MFCANCGTRLDDQAFFCPECGWKIEWEPETEAETEAKVAEAVEEPKAEVAPAEAPEEPKAETEPTDMAIPEEPKAESAISSEAEQFLNQQTNDLKLYKSQPADQGKINTQPIDLHPKVPKKKKKLWPAILIACVALALLSAGGYGIYRSIVERNIAEANRIQTELEEKEAAMRKAQKERKEAEAKEKAREELKQQMFSQIQKTKNLMEQFESLSDEEEIDEGEIEALVKEFHVQKAGYQAFQTSDDKKLYQAGLRYYELQDEYVTISCETIRAVEDIYGFCEELSKYAELDPMSYRTLDDYIDECNLYLDQMDELYAQIEPPEYLVGWWGQIREELDMLPSFLTRGAEAVYYDDVLRYESFLNLNDYAMHKLLQEVNESMLILEGVVDILEQKSETADAIYKEIANVSALSHEERENHVFANYNGKLLSHCDSIERIYPMLYNAIDQFAIMELACVSGARDVIVEFEIPGLTQNQKQSYHVDDQLTTIFLKPPALEMPADLSTVKNGQMRIVITETNGDVIETHSAPVEIMSQYDFRWSNDEFGYMSINNILCFMTPESTAIADLKREAVNKMSELTSDKMNAFPGYQNTFGAAPGKEYVNTYLQAMGLMIALSDMEVRYVMNAFSSSGTTQHITLPEEVLKSKSGLCIETSLVVASALQSANLHTFLVLPDGHAQVAVETWLGSGEYFLIETTWLPNERSKFVSYCNDLLAGRINEDRGLEYVSYGYPIVKMTNKAWKKYIEDQNVILIDCGDSSLLGTTPFVHIGE